MLEAVSIFGDGDKIALPPSVLETLSQSLMDETSTVEQQQQPWIFRIGILNPNYTFPASSILQSMSLSPDDEEDEEGYEDNDIDNDDDDDSHSNAAYLDELRHKYLAYTHGTVVEFTQDEGCVGLPIAIASRLLHQAAGFIPATRTVDRASVADVAQTMEHSENMVMSDDNEDDTVQTPGHLAWGAFDIPAVPIEITRVQLSRGRRARLRPTEDAVRDGFYNLKDVKLVLEQSLVRTRATLTVEDVISTWNRGTRFDLTVQSVTPAAFHAISCINTDIEIDFESLNSEQPSHPKNEPSHPKNETLGAFSSVNDVPHGKTTGRRLDDSETELSPGEAHIDLPLPLVSLPPEPPIDQRDGVVAIQIRGEHGVRGYRRFLLESTTVSDLFAFAQTLVSAAATNISLCDSNPQNAGHFQLVTRFPRRVLTSNDSSWTLLEVGISEGQELFLLEPLN